MPCRRFPLDNVIVKGFRVKDVALDDVDFALSDHRIVVVPDCKNAEGSKGFAGGNLEWVVTRL